MARAAAKKKPQVEQPTNDERLQLLSALKFAAVAIEKTDATQLSTYVTIRDHWLTASNETFGLGAAVQTGLEICPQSAKFLAALEQCGNTFQMVQIAENELSVKSAGFRGIVPVLKADLLASPVPDPQCALLTRALNDAFRTCVKACIGKGERVFDYTVLMRPGSCIGTNGGFVLEHWHGIDLPEAMAIPRKTVDAICRLDKPMTGFGFTPGLSATFYFEDGTWLRTRLANAPWPERLDGLLNDNMGGPWIDVWPGFVDAINALGKFCEDDTIHFHENVIATGAQLEHAAAAFAVAGLPAGHRFSLAYWRIILPYVGKLTPRARPADPWAFAAGAVRGLVLGKHA